MKPRTMLRHGGGTMPSHYFCYLHNLLLLLLLHSIHALPPYTHSSREPAHCHVFLPVHDHVGEHACRDLSRLMSYLFSELVVGVGAITCVIDGVVALVVEMQEQVSAGA